MPSTATAGTAPASRSRQMAQLGFTEAYDLKGGIGAWESAGGDVVTGG